MGFNSVDNAVAAWTHSKHPSRAVASTDASQPPPTFYPNSKNGPYILFEWNRLDIVNPSGGLPDGVRTIISVHTFSNEKQNAGNQWYIIAGSDQGALHGSPNIASSPLWSGDGVWAGGDAFRDGSIRLNGAHEVAINGTEVTIGSFKDTTLASVLCTEPGLVNRRGPGMNRLGIDRKYHSFKGRLHELLVYNRRLDTEELALIEKYLIKKWKL